jgi:hypothetical protein
MPAWRQRKGMGFRRDDCKCFQALCAAAYHTPPASTRDTTRPCPSIWQRIPRMPTKRNNTPRQPLPDSIVLWCVSVSHTAATARRASADRAIAAARVSYREKLRRAAPPCKPRPPACRSPAARGTWRAIGTHVAKNNLCRGSNCREDLCRGWLCREDNCRPGSAEG